MALKFAASNIAGISVRIVRSSFKRTIICCRNSKTMELSRKIASFPLPKQNILSFSSSSSSAMCDEFQNSFFNDSDSGSAVYRNALRFQRPETIKWQLQLLNFVSFIGTVVFPLKKFQGTKKFGVHTVLEVRPSGESNSAFKITLNMWGEMAEISFKHLKPNDFIYVSGRLDCFSKITAGEKLITYYKVIVNELNYVAHNGRRQTYQKSETQYLKEETSYLEKQKENLYLWQVFLANPHEWWDNRKGKLNPKAPDFKHKDTGEVLWLNPHDPPWVRRQLQLYDSRMAERGYRESVDSRSRLSMWKYED